MRITAQVIVKRNSLPAYPDKIDEAIRAINQETGSMIVALAQALAPVRNGNLRGSIHYHEISATEAEVLAGTGLATAEAVYMEYGTGSRGAASAKGESESGALTYKGGWEGVAARPYMTPAAESARSHHLDLLENLESRL